MNRRIGAAVVSAGLLVGSALSGIAYAGELLKANGVSTEADAISYYNTIDPANLRLTQDAWREVNGFNDPANEIIVVKGHKNVSDLGFWRRIEMVIDKRAGYEGNVAMTTFNYATESDAVNNMNALSIVNMEYSPGPDGDRITKFYIYRADGTRKLSTIFDPNLAAAEELFLPNACASCHGGGREADFGGDDGGGFLAFDFNVFEYGTLANRADNEANVKKLNQGVLMTRPTSAVRSLVRLLYGGRDLPLNEQNSAYRPSDWDSEPALWNVVVTDCLGCHTLSSEDVLSLKKWKEAANDFHERVIKKKNMPNAPYSNERFWNTDHHLIVEDALIRFGAR